MRLQALCRTGTATVLFCLPIFFNFVNKCDTSCDQAELWEVHQPNGQCSAGKWLPIISCVTSLMALWSCLPDTCSHVISFPDSQTRSHFVTQESCWVWRWYISWGMLKWHYSNNRSEITLIKENHWGFMKWICSLCVFGQEYSLHWVKQTWARFKWVTTMYFK